MRVFAYISYKGTNYHGWQMQNNAMSVQQEITESLGLLLKDKSLSILGSGRTDAGVHAKNQVFHVDIPDDTDLEHLKFRLNSFLENDIVVNKIIKVNPNAHARFDAISRSYEYHLRCVRTPFRRDEFYYHKTSLDFNLMNEAASYLIGTHDFQSFSRVKTEVNNFVCDITRAEWVTHENGAVFHISANRFLRSMVRAIVGTLLRVGEGKITPKEIMNIIERKDRNEAGEAVPGKGLYLCKVEYPNINN
jgi:tRNA pseudouridine38-40 synthase